MLPTIDTIVLKRCPGRVERRRRKPFFLVLGTVYGTIDDDDDDDDGITFHIVRERADRECPLLDCDFRAFPVEDKNESKSLPNLIDIHGGSNFRPLLITMIVQNGNGWRWWETGKRRGTVEEDLFASCA